MRKESEVGFSPELTRFGERYIGIIQEDVPNFIPEAFWPIDVLALTEDDGTNPIIDNPDDITDAHRGILRAIIWDTLGIGNKPPFRRYTFQESTLGESSKTAHVRVFETNVDPDFTIHEVVNPEGTQLDWIVGTRDENYPNEE